MYVYSVPPRIMNSSYLSYHPDDYFWSSVKDKFDFSICKQLEGTPTPPPPSFLLSGIITQDSSCNCPTTLPGNKKTKLPNNSNYPTSVSNNTNHMDEYTKQLCYNYIHSKRLIDLQNKTSASQSNFSDNSNQYNKIIRQTVNVSIGILAIIITIGYT